MVNTYTQIDVRNRVHIFYIFHNIFCYSNTHCFCTCIIITYMPPINYYIYYIYLFIILFIILFTFITSATAMSCLSLVCFIQKGNTCFFFFFCITFLYLHDHTYNIQYADRLVCTDKILYTFPQIYPKSQRIINVRPLLLIIQYVKLCFAKDQNSRTALVP